MAIAAEVLTTRDVPADTFGVRLAVIRAALGGWNVKRAAEFCGIPPQNWRNWEAGKACLDYEGACRAIARATGYSYRWISAGGPLSQRDGCLFALPAPLGQGTFDDLWTEPEPVRAFALVGS